MENIETLLAAVAQSQGFDDEESAPSASTSRGQGSEHPKTPVVIAGDDPQCVAADVPPLAPKAVALVPGPAIGAREKRKRGRPPKGQLRVKTPPPKRNKMAEDEEEEDVCFICFDGGSLVLCDRKGCPKAYHPACIKRDEAFFRCKAKWNCGWHICSVCQKASYYKCYTCTYSLCKGCAKDTNYVCVRGNKGFCVTCMKTIMLIENKDANNEIKVDFDDETSWEYLFKVYWVCLKEKLSLTLNDLTRAKNPWKSATAIGYRPPKSISTPATVSVDINVNCIDTLELKRPHVENNLPLPSDSNNVEKHTNGFEGDGPTKQSMDEVMQETSIKKAIDDPAVEKDPVSVDTTKDTDNLCEESKQPGVNHSTEWATKNLLEFVAHVKDGDVSAMSIFDVQTLLLDYINRNSLWDPRRKSQVICDPELKSVFGKTRIGHIEMLKILKAHILVKQDFQNNSSIPAGFVSSVRSDREVDESGGDIESGNRWKKDDYVMPSCLNFLQNGRKPNSPNEGKEDSSAQVRDRTHDKADTSESNSSDKYMNQENTNLTTNSTNYRDVQRSELETSTATASVGNSSSPNIVESEKLWHYRDPEGKIRGPFSMFQLRECSSTGLYAPDMRIWTNHEQYDWVFLTDALSKRFHRVSDSLNSGSEEEEAATGEVKVISEGTKVSGGESKKGETCSNDASVSSENDVGAVRADKFGSWPQCWDLLTDNNHHTNNSDVSNRVQTHNVLPSPRLEEKHETLSDYGHDSENFHHCEARHGEMVKNSTGLPQNTVTSGREIRNESNGENPHTAEHLKSLDTDLSSNYMGLSKLCISNKETHHISMLDFPAGPNTDAPAQNTSFLDLLSLDPRSGNEDHAMENKNSGFTNFPSQISEMVDELCKFPFAFSLKPPEALGDHSAATLVPAPPLNVPMPMPMPMPMPSWLASTNEPIEFVALGEESVSDLLAEVDAMESKGAPRSPSDDMKFAHDLLDELRDDCFNPVEAFSAKTDPMTRTEAQSGASSEGETNTPGGVGPSDACVDPGWGALQGHINLLTVQGNVNLVLGGPPGWASPGLGRGAIGGSVPWDGQWKYGSPRERAGGYQGAARSPWGRQASSYSRSVPKGQRVCKFYESGRCRKGAFCDYLHP